jgi:hypothetical protein
MDYCGTIEYMIGDRLADPHDNAQEVVCVSPVASEVTMTP